MRWRASHRRVSHIRVSFIGHPIGVSLTGVCLRGVHLSYTCLPSHRPSHRHASPIDHYLIGVSLIGASLIDMLLTEAIP
jgi:hypothetical protein